MPLPTLYNTRTTVVDLSTAMFADSASPGVSPVGVATANSLSLYQSSDGLGPGTFALIPTKIDISNCDTFQFSFKYNSGGYVGNTAYNPAAYGSWEGMELGFILNAGDFSQFQPALFTTFNGPNDVEIGVTGLLYASYGFHDGTDNHWELHSTMPPRTGYANGADLTHDVFLYPTGDPWLSSGAYDGTSTLTLQVRLPKVQTDANDAANGIPGGNGQTITAIATWLAENGQVMVQSDADYPATLFHLDVATADNSAAYDVLASPYLPLTLTPYIRRRTTADTAGHPQTLSNLVITVGSSTKPVFWTDLQGCVEG